MNLQENINRIQQIIEGDKKDNTDRIINIGVSTLETLYGKMLKAIGNVNRPDDVTYMLNGKVILRYNKKFKLAHISETVWDNTMDWLGITNRHQLQTIFKLWLEKYYKLEIGTINDNIAIVRLTK